MPRSRKLRKDESLLYKDDAEVNVIGAHGADIRWQKWTDMDLDTKLLKNIKDCGFVWPRKVQEVMIPYITEGYNIKCQSETGTGKTAAYLIPIINNLLKEKTAKELATPNSPLCVIIAPTRELIDQIYQEALTFTRNTQIRVAKAYGGIRTKVNVNQIKKGCTILCATFGRLFSLLKKIHVSLSVVEYVVFDEADKFMAGSEKENQDIIRFMKNKDLPEKEKRQMLYVSPTLREENIKDIVNMNTDTTKMVFIKSAVQLNQRIDHDVRCVPFGSHKIEFLIQCIRNLIAKHNGKCPRILVFTNTMKTADYVALVLQSADLPASADHSKLPQETRHKILSGFRKGDAKTRIIVSINVCGRGLDVLELDYVFIYEIPEIDTTCSLIQRCGRTGRVRNGQAIVLYQPGEDDRWLGYVRAATQQEVDVKRELSDQKIAHRMAQIPAGKTKSDFLIECIRKLVAQNNDKYPQVVVLTNNKKTADEVAALLLKAQLPAAAGHRDLNKIERKKILDGFKKGDQTTRIIVTVNITSVDQVNLEMDEVIFFDVPDQEKKWSLIQRMGPDAKIRSERAILLFEPGKDDQWIKSIRDATGHIIIPNESNDIVSAMNNLNI